MIAFLFYILLFSNTEGLFAKSDCPQIEKSFIIGDYEKCENISSVSLNSIRCRYIRTLCMMANASYDKARYDLSLISADMPKDAQAPGELNALALTSLAELAFLQGDYPRGRNLSESVNNLLTQKLSGSYPHSVSRVLVLKSQFDARNFSSIKQQLSLMRSNMDLPFYRGLDPWK